MKILIVVHANMALTDNWTYDPYKGLDYYDSVLDVRKEFDLVLTPFFKPYYSDHKEEHDKFVKACSIFDVCGFEENSGDLISNHLDEILLSNEVTEISFAGGYATDCLPRTIYRFLDDYGSYCEQENITIKLRHDLIYDGVSCSLLSENKRPNALYELVTYSGFYRFENLKIRGNEYDKR